MTCTFQADMVKRQNSGQTACHSYVDVEFINCNLRINSKSAIEIQLGLVTAEDIFFIQHTIFSFHNSQFLLPFTSTIHVYFPFNLSPTDF